ncbi:MAG: site-specific DNA-methyltransferase [Clostridiales bacterium]|jgi:DNA modification methylase|nr:site-specific DNA-methyltransferase [Clostridiales bacterium]
MVFDKGSTGKARSLAQNWINTNLNNFAAEITCGLPEYDDRLDSWRISLKYRETSVIGELQANRRLTEIKNATKTNLIIERIRKAIPQEQRSTRRNSNVFVPAAIPNKIILGDCVQVLEEYPPDTAQLVFTSPPYYNAKPEYSEFVDYQEYLDFLRRVFIRCHSILSEGRFLVVNVSPVLIKRASRSTSSTRIPIPFDIHQIMKSIGFDFVDDIIWEKPEGAGWNVGRGRRFRADRQPLQYKPVTVTEYVLVYRKHTEKLIDWNIRKHHSQEYVTASKILGDYDVTNIWRIPPNTSKIHPATFPEALARKIIRYYSFINDMVVDPFAGIGTVGYAAIELGRRFMLIDTDPKYYAYMKKNIIKKVSEDTRVDCYIYNDHNEGE